MSKQLIPRRGWSIGSRATPYLFVAPYVVIALAFMVYPVIKAGELSFYRTYGAMSRAFVGLENFSFVLTDPEFHTALWNTTVFAAASIFIQLPIALGLALLLNGQRDRLRGVFRFIIFSPHLVGQIFVGILFAVLFTPRYGLINRAIHGLTGSGLDRAWLFDPALVMPAIVLTSIWLYAGFNMIYFLAALQNVDQGLVEAAKIDGAGPFGIFWNVALPAIRPVAMFVVIMSTIGSYQLFELPYALLDSGFGPNDSGLTIVGYLYRHAFQEGDLGTGAAIGWILTLIILLISLAQIRLTKAFSE